jgi:nucleotidyltransferase substrate binding protein (TIGR01987 family)
VETIEKRYKIVLQSLATLHEAINLLNDPQYKQIYKSLRDSAIQRFEYSIDTFWKFLKIYMQEKNKILLEAATPRIILREAVNASIISEDEFIQLIKGISDRNLTSHSYNEEIAKNLIESIPANYNLMKKITERIVIS